MLALNSEIQLLRCCINPPKPHFNSDYWYGPPLVSGAMTFSTVLGRGRCGSAPTRDVRYLSLCVRTLGKWLHFVWKRNLQRYVWNVAGNFGGMKDVFKGLKVSGRKFALHKINNNCIENNIYEYKHDVSTI